jgi:hypothetical protein
MYRATLLFLLLSLSIAASSAASHEEPKFRKGVPAGEMLSIGMKGDGAIIGEMFERSEKPARRDIPDLDPPAFGEAGAKLYSGVRVRTAIDAGSPNSSGRFGKLELADGIEVHRHLGGNLFLARNSESGCKARAWIADASNSRARPTEILPPGDCKGPSARSKYEIAIVADVPNRTLFVGVEGSPTLDR